MVLSGTPGLVLGGTRYQQCKHYTGLWKRRKLSPSQNHKHREGATRDGLTPNLCTVTGLTPGHI